MGGEKPTISEVGIMKIRKKTTKNTEWVNQLSFHIHFCLWPTKKETWKKVNPH